MSSMEGEGSTFGFFFKVRRSSGTSEDVRPPFPSRSDSDNSNTPGRAQTPGSRPPYSRANSNLRSIKEKEPERPPFRTLTSHSGVDADDVNESLENPPTEYMAEAHPAASKDSRFDETSQIARNFTDNKLAIENKLPDLEKGETDIQEKTAEDLSRSHSSQQAEDKQTLLLVEDNLINQKVLRRQLQSRGFEVFVASNGQEAIDAVVQRGRIASDNPNDRNYFDCILMDQEMPVKDGNAATEEIRELQNEGKAGYSHILGVSANVRDVQTKHMRKAGMDDVISKPFKVDDLVKKINGMIRDNGGGEHEHNRESGWRPPKTEEGDIRDGRADNKSEDTKGKSEDRKDAEMTLPITQSGERINKAADGNGREGDGRGGERSRTKN